MSQLNVWSFLVTYQNQLSCVTILRIYFTISVTTPMVREDRNTPVSTLAALKPCLLARVNQTRTLVLALLMAGCGHRHVVNTDEVVRQETFLATRVNFNSNGIPTTTIERAIPSAAYTGHLVFDARTQANARARHDALAPLLREILVDFNLSDPRVLAALVNNHYLVERERNRHYLGCYSEGSMPNGDDIIDIAPTAFERGPESTIRHEVSHDLFEHAVAPAQRDILVSDATALFATDYQLGADSIGDGDYFALRFLVPISDYFDRHGGEYGAVLAQVPGASVEHLQAAVMWYVQFLFMANRRFYNGYHRQLPTIELSWQRFLRRELFSLIIEKYHGVPAWREVFDPVLSVQGRDSLYQSHSVHNPFLQSRDSLRVLIGVLRPVMAVAYSQVAEWFRVHGQSMETLSDAVAD